jgi:hypothetical protein
LTENRPRSLQRSCDFLPLEASASPVHDIRIGSSRSGHRNGSPRGFSAAPSEAPKASSGDAQRMITVQECLSPHSRRQDESWRVGVVA